jgi:hypothetical protein
MPDRVIRDELLDSDRWLGLGHDTERLAFVAMLLRCDDFGNMEGGVQRLFRTLSPCTQIKTPENMAAVLQHLADADLIRLYQVDGRELIHIPRLRPHRQYLVRKVPASPWCDVNTPLGKVKRVIERGLARNVVTTSQQRSNDVAQGVGVGVGVGVGEILKTRARKAVPVDNFPQPATATETSKPDGDKSPELPKPNPPSVPNPPSAGSKWWHTPQGIEAQARTVGVAAKPGESHRELKDRVFAMIHARPEG